MNVTDIELALRDKKGFIFDIDGTVALGTQPLGEARAFFELLRRHGRRTLIYTNNPNRSHREAADYLRAMGYDVAPDDVVSTSDVAVEYIKEHHPNARVFVLGVPSWVEHLKEQGLSVVDADADEADVVLIGYDKTLTWEKAAMACRMIAKGATFLATHSDPCVPTDVGMLPDCGSMCAMIETASGVAPKYLGKPWTLGLPLIEHVTGMKPRELCMVGDRLNTDIAFANRAGMTSLLVLTGATTAEQAASATGMEAPDFTVPDLSVLMDMFN